MVQFTNIFISWRYRSADSGAGEGWNSDIDALPFSGAEKTYFFHLPLAKRKKA